MMTTRVWKLFKGQIAVMVVCPFLLGVGQESENIAQAAV
jgi:hypothetical protein